MAPFQLKQRKEARSEKSAKHKGDDGALGDSPTWIAPVMSEKNPPSYGAQHRQDALWEGE